MKTSSVDINGTPASACTPGLTVDVSPFWQTDYFVMGTLTCDGACAIERSICPKANWKWRPDRENKQDNQADKENKENKRRRLKIIFYDAIGKVGVTKRLRMSSASVDTLLVHRTFVHKDISKI